MAYVNRRSGKNGAERFTGIYKAADGTLKSAGTFATETRALEVAEAAERHARLQLAETSPADKATVTLATYMEVFLSTADIEANSKETYARHLTLHVIPYIGKQRVAEVSRETIHRLLTVVLKEKGASHGRSVPPRLQRTSAPARKGARPPRGLFGRAAVRADLIHPGRLRLRRGHASRAQIHRGSDREVPSHRGPVSHAGVHQERRASPVQGRSRGLGNGAGAHRASRNQARPGDLPGTAVRLYRGRRPGPAHPGGDRCPGLHR
jgi:hypothetical protein